MVEGEEAVRTPEGTETLGRWELAFFPTGPEGAHGSETNPTGRRGCSCGRRSSTRRSPSTPTATSWGVRPGTGSDDLIVRRGDGVGYYEGEAATVRLIPRPARRAPGRVSGRGRRVSPPPSWGRGERSWSDCGTRPPAAACARSGRRAPRPSSARGRRRAPDARRRAARRPGGHRGPAVRRSRAGGLLEEALEEAGIDRRRVYVTNAVKHFKWVPRGNRRIHEKPNAREVAACRPWLDAEIAVVRRPCSCASARPRRRRCSARSSGSPSSAARSFDSRSRADAHRDPPPLGDPPRPPGAAPRDAHRPGGRPTGRRRGRLRRLTAAPGGRDRRRAPRAGRPPRGRTRVPPPSGITCTTSASWWAIHRPRPPPPPAARRACARPAGRGRDRRRAPRRPTPR